jgi:AAA domain
MGQAGAGKTTLALRYIELARKRGMATARASATRASQALPFGALAPFLPPDLEGDGLGRENRTGLLRRYSRALAEMGRGRPLLVFVDDAHLLDGGSARLVHQLALTGAATALVTVRSGVTAPDPVLALWKDALAERIVSAGADSSSGTDSRSPSRFWLECAQSQGASAGWAIGRLGFGRGVLNESRWTSSGPSFQFRCGRPGGVIWMLPGGTRKRFPAISKVSVPDRM